MERYENFKKELKKELEQRFGPKCWIEFETVMRNNGVVQDSVLIQQWGEERKTAISLSLYWDMYRRGDGMWKIFSEFLKDYESENIALPFPAVQLLDFNQMKERVVYRLINAELNRELLTQVPYVPFLDLAIVFALQLWSGDSSQLNCLINHQHLELWGVTPEILYPLAKENTPRLLPLRLCHICDVIGLPEIEAEPVIEEPEMYVLTNRYEVYGAAALLYPDALKTAADELDSDLLILPSSIHEVLVVPRTDMDGKMDFEEMVREINTTDVLPEDILSYRIYQYDRKTEQVTIYEGDKEPEGGEHGTGTKYQ